MGTPHFSRNLGLVSDEEQEQLWKSTVAVAGVGGVGGLPAERLARLGIGHIKIADPEVFSETDLNRQFGSSRSAIGRKKADVIRDVILDINPGIEVTAFSDGLTKANLASFLDGTDLVIDAIEFFIFGPRFLLYPAARAKGVTVILSGAVGYGSPLLVFEPRGMTMERYFSLDPASPAAVDFSVIAHRLCPKMPDYVSDELKQRILKREVPITTVSPTCSLAGSLLAQEALFLLLDKRPPVVVPRSMVLDLYRREYVEVDLSGEFRD